MGPRDKWMRGRESKDGFGRICNIDGINWLNNTMCTVFPQMRGNIMAGKGINMNNLIKLLEYVK